MSGAPRIVTIGGYGYDESRFANALLGAHVDLFVDIRQRRGMRGSRYAFLNSERLQALLRQLEIRYLHARELAPTTDARDAQKDADAASQVAKRDRTVLSPEFVARYRASVLAPCDISLLRAAFGEARAIALFCVESHPAACHRSLAAEFLSKQLGASVEHLKP